MDIEIKDNSASVIAAKNEAIAAALEAVGLQAEGYAKMLEDGFKHPTGRLRNSITHGVDGGDTAYIGTTVGYAPYVEFGTGIYASNGGGRKDPWAYQDDEGKWHMTRGIKPTHAFQKAVNDHKSEYEAIIKAHLQGK